MPTDFSHDEQLIEALLADSAAPLARELESRIATDAALRGRAAELRAMLAGLRTLKEEAAGFEVSVEQRRRLASLWHAERPSFVDRARAAAREIVAALVFDSWRQPALAGLRGESAARLLRLSCDEASIDLRVSKGSPGAMSVTGQIEGAPRASRVVARGPDERDVVATIEPGGYFELDLPAGLYGLRFEGDAITIVVDAIDLGAPRAG